MRGLRLHVAEAGEGEPVVLQHGWPQHWYQWREVIPALAERYRVICPDLRGFGWSEVPPDGDLLKETLADDLLALFESLGLERLRYVGHDWGGFIGFLLCLRPDHPIERMVALSVLAPWPPERIDPRDALLLWYQLPIAGPLPRRLKLAFFAQILRRGRADGSFTAEQMEAYLAPLREPGRLWSSRRMYSTFLARELGPAALGRYAGRRLTTPALLMIGDRDALHQPWAEETLHRHAGGAEFEVVPGAGHFLPEERPAHVAERLLDFLSR